MNGDIVKREMWSDTASNHRVVEYAKVLWIEEFAEYHLVNRKEETLWNIGDEKHRIEVCGNIYDNPDLLGE